MLSAEEIGSLLRVADQVSPADRKKILQLLEHDRVNRCREDFLAYVSQVWPVFIGGKHHKIMANAFERVARGELKRLIVNMPPRHAILTSMKIPTTQGMKLLSDVKVGDFVFGPEGIPVEVIGKSEVFKNRELYCVTTDDGASLVVDGEHLWTVRLDRKRNKFNDYTTEELWRRQRGEVLRTKRGGGTEFIANRRLIDVRLPKLPDAYPVWYPTKKLPIDPYVLGVWLGDGTARCGVITSDDTDAVIVRQEFEKRGVTTTNQTTPKTFGTLGLQVKLKELGVLGNKHIPRIYLEADIEQRRDLLKGLMDTDGNVSKAGQCFFAQSNKDMIDAVAELIRSLGIKASILESEAKINEVSYGRTWKISFYAQDVFMLPRKEARTKKTPNKFGRYISVERLNKTGDTQCIKVDRADGLFLAGDGFIVTHNTKSEFASYLLPSWFLGRFPEKKIIQAAHTAELSMGFGRKVRNLVSSEPYQKIFNTKLSTDSKAANRWNTDKGGEYFAVGVNGAVTGKGADLLVIDDPHSEQEAKLGNPAVYDQVYEWYTSGPRQRLQPGGAIIIVMTRWSKKDLTGQILKNSSKDGADDWEVIEFPAILPSGNPLWPGFWKKEELEAIKAELPVGKWEAQYQQNPTSEEGAIVKREFWKIWTDNEPPDCEYVIQSWDTAFEKHNRADYSACTTWGVFHAPDKRGEMKPNIILLDAYKDRLEFPELKQKAFDMWKEWNPDTLLIEKRAAGAPLIYELRKMGIPLSEYTPYKGQDKIARVNSIADLFASGVIWRPETRWAEEVVEEMASFPNAEHDDLTDSASQALMRFRQGGFISVETDEADEPVYRRRAVYY